MDAKIIMQANISIESLFQIYTPFAFLGLFFSLLSLSLPQKADMQRPQQPVSLPSLFSASVNGESQQDLRVTGELPIPGAPSLSSGLLLATPLGRSLLLQRKLNLLISAWVPGVIHFFSNFQEARPQFLLSSHYHPVGLLYQLQVLAHFQIIIFHLCYPLPMGTQNETALLPCLNSLQPILLFQALG